MAGYDRSLGLHRSIFTAHLNIPNVEAVSVPIEKLINRKNQDYLS